MHRFPNILRFIPGVACGLALTLGSAALADPLPPPDPDREKAAVAFTPQRAMRHRDPRSLRDLQDAAGSDGKIVERSLDAETPRIVLQWTGASGRMRASVYSSGDFGATIIPAESGAPIVLNNFGAFVCAQCAAPVSACGRRPSWIPHDLHWDNFDCRCALTGPQSVKAGAC